MIRDPIVEEVRELRRQTEQAYEGNWDKLIDHYRRIAEQSDHPVYRGSPRPLSRSTPPETK